MTGLDYQTSTQDHGLLAALNALMAGKCLTPGQMLSLRDRGWLNLHGEPELDLVHVRWALTPLGQRELTVWRREIVKKR